MLGAAARAHHRAHPEGASAVRIVTWLGVLLPRVMFPGSLAAAARYASGEPLWTGRRRAYAERTLRQAADRLDAEGASTHVAHAVWWKQAEGAVAKVDEAMIAHTDMFDQAYLRLSTTYRQTGVRNGPTVLPLDLATGLIERGTPRDGEGRRARLREA